MRRPPYTVVVGAAIVVAATYLSMSWQAAEPTRPAEQPRRVRVADVSGRTDARVLRFPATTRATRRASLGFIVGGRLASRPVEPGQRVRAGQPLGRLDLRELDHAAQAASSSLAELSARSAQLIRERARVERLAAAKAATTEELEQASTAADAIEASRAAAETRVREAERLLSEGTIVAPYEGTVVAVHAEPGETLNPGQPIVDLVGDGGVEVEVGVPESVVAGLVEEDRAELTFPFLPGKTMTGRITSIGRASDAGRLFPVVVTLDRSGDIAAGLAAEVALPVAANDAVSVPLAAVINPGGSRPQVFRLNDTTIESVVLEIDSLHGEQVTVRGALRPGDRVVVAGHLGLVDGDRVEVVR